MAKVEFVKYTGKYPCYCGGTLYVKINGKMIAFNGIVKGRKVINNKNIVCYPKFRKSSGGCHYYDDGVYKDQINEQAPWKFDIGFWNENEYPDDVMRLMDELLRIMNEKVEWGCCGGCI